MTQNYEWIKYIIYNITKNSQGEYRYLPMGYILLVTFLFSESHLEILTGMHLKFVL